jgi:hypothetical protein
MASDVITFESAYMHDRAAAADQARALVDEARAGLRKANRHDGWRCRERDEINRGLEELLPKLDKLSEGLNSIFSAMKKGADQFAELEERALNQESALADSLRRDYSFEGELWVPGESETPSAGSAPGGTEPSDDSAPEHPDDYFPIKVGVGPVPNPNDPPKDFKDIIKDYLIGERPVIYPDPVPGPGNPFPPPPLRLSPTWPPRLRIPYFRIPRIPIPPGVRPWPPIYVNLPIYMTASDASSSAGAQPTIADTSPAVSADSAPVAVRYVNEGSGGSGSDFLSSFLSGNPGSYSGYSSGSSDSSSSSSENSEFFKLFFEWLKQILGAPE